MRERGKRGARLEGEKNAAAPPLPRRASSRRRYGARFREPTTPGERGRRGESNTGHIAARGAAFKVADGGAMASPVSAPRTSTRGAKNQGKLVGEEEGGVARSPRRETGAEAARNGELCAADEKFSRRRFSAQERVEPRQDEKRMGEGECSGARGALHLKTEARVGRRGDRGRGGFGLAVEAEKRGGSG